MTKSTDHYTLDLNKRLKIVLSHYLTMLEYVSSEVKDDNDKEAWESEILDVECMMEIFCR